MRQPSLCSRKKQRRGSESELTPAMDWFRRIKECPLAISFMRRFPAIVDRGFGFDLVAFQDDLARGFFNADADQLLARGSGAGVADNVIAEEEVFGFAAD